MLFLLVFKQHLSNTLFLNFYIFDTLLSKYTDKAIQQQNLTSYNS